MRTGCPPARAREGGLSTSVSISDLPAPRRPTSQAGPLPFKPAGGIAGGRDICPRSGVGEQVGYFSLYSLLFGPQPPFAHVTLGGSPRRWGSSVHGPSAVHTRARAPKPRLIIAHTHLTLQPRRARTDTTFATMALALS